MFSSLMSRATSRRSSLNLAQYSIDKEIYVAFQVQESEDTDHHEGFIIYCIDNKLQIAN